MAKTMNKNKVLKLLELFPEIDGEIKEGLEIILVENMDEVAERAFV